jgi:hypothetical protein
MAGPGNEFIVQYPDQISVAIKLLVGAVVSMGLALIAGAKWIAAYIIKRFETQFESFGLKIDRIATSLETLEKNTSVEIATIKGDIKGVIQVCAERTTSGTCDKGSL